jgi:hypothetical protein
MSGAVLEHKLDAQDEKNPEEAWNLARWPSHAFRLGETNRLFVACDGAWRGYFVLSGEALYNPDDERTPFTILFDTRTWTEIRPVPAKRFRGFTYDVPRDPGPPAAAGPPAVP